MCRRSSPPSRTPPTPAPMRWASASRRVSLSGQRQVSREEILAAAGVTGPFLAAVPRCRPTRARRLEGDPVDRRGDRAQALSGPAADQHHGARAVRAVAEGGQASRSSPPTARCCETRSSRVLGLPLRGRRGRGRRARSDFLALLDTLSRDPRPGARLDPGRRAALEPAAEERHRRAAAGDRHRGRARDAWSRSIARRTCSPATSWRSTCASPTA